jgi:hypothetical protein
LLEVILKRLDDSELETVFDLLSALLSKHLDEQEYHALFLKENHP